jgi:hypothetical protein
VRGVGLGELDVVGGSRVLVVHEALLSGLSGLSGRSGC